MSHTQVSINITRAREVKWEKEGEGETLGEEEREQRQAKTFITGTIRVQSQFFLGWPLLILPSSAVLRGILTESEKNTL